MLKCGDISPFHQTKGVPGTKGMCILPRGHMGEHTCECNRFSWEVVGEVTETTIPYKEDA